MEMNKGGFGLLCFSLDDFVFDTLRSVLLMAKNAVGGD
jgi:hypothetical protein